MNRQAFLEALSSALSDLGMDVWEEALDYYAELTADLIEQGMSEQCAVQSMGSVEAIAANISSGLAPQQKAPAKPARIVRIIARAAFVVRIAAVLAGAAILLAAMWALVLLVLAIALLLALMLPAGIVAAALCLFFGAAAAGSFLLGAGMFLGGLSIPVFFGAAALLRAGVRRSVRAKEWFVTKLKKGWDER
jgi:uncharacterized membrane protein